MRTKSARALTLLLALGGTLSRAHADPNPIIQFTTQGQFQTGILNGLLTGITITGGDPRNQANLNALRFIYNASPLASDTFLATSSSLNGGTGGMVSATLAFKGLQTVGGHSYKGPDPDFTNAQFDLGLYLPQVGFKAGIDAVSVALIDTSGRVKYWLWDTPALTVGFQGFLFRLNDGVGAGGSTLFGIQSGFDITHSDILQVAYRGTLTSTYPALPPLDRAIDPNARLWIGDSRFVIVPEPGSVSICLLGISQCGIWVWRRGKRARLHSNA